MHEIEEEEKERKDEEVGNMLRNTPKKNMDNPYLAQLHSGPYINEFHIEARDLVLHNYLLNGESRMSSGVQSRKSGDFVDAYLSTP